MKLSKYIDFLTLDEKTALIYSIKTRKYFQYKKEDENIV